MEGQGDLIMRTSYVALTLILAGINGTAFGQANFAPPAVGDTSNAALEDRNEALVLRLVNEVFASGDQAAAAQIVSADAVVHGKQDSTGVAGVLALFNDAMMRIPNAKAVVKHSGADGDFVAVQAHVTATPGNENSGEQWIDFFRLRDGKVVEAWLSSNEAKPSVSGHSQFSDDYVPRARAGKLTEAQEQANLVPHVQSRREGGYTSREVFEKYWAKDFKQHATNLADGSEAMWAMMARNLAAAAAPPPAAQQPAGGPPGGGPMQIQVIAFLSDDDLVWEIASVGSGTYLTDIYRMADNLVVEHYEVPPGLGPAPGGVATPVAGFRPPQGASGLKIDQVTIQTGSPSEGRGKPATTNNRPIVGPSSGTAGDVFGARDGNAPKGYTPLPRDLFNSNDFYADKDLWSDPRYFRCASPGALEAYWENANDNTSFGFNRTGTDFPRTAAWGKCENDIPLEDIVSPYKYTTAQQHYAALLAEARSRGGPTRHTYADLPRWNGVYAKYGFGEGLSAYWYRVSAIQASTYLKLLTPEYQQRMVQQMYHTGKSNAPVYPGAYCWPEGYMRRWFAFSEWVTLVPEMAQFMTTMSEPIPTQAMIGQTFDMSGSSPNLLGDVRQWYGDVIGFWDGDVLITWRSNIKGWLAHGWFEWSNEMQAIEIYSPIVARDDGRFVGINHEAILYDPKALAKPVRISQNWEWSGTLEGPAYRMDWRVCNQTLFPTNGRQTPESPGKTIQYDIPDWSNRPWAQIWEKYFEKGMKKPEGTNPLAGFE
jgi:predicted SnoaL-like aldol condensation-catalyzing enzyme